MTTETLNVAVSWWKASEPPGGASQAIRGNVKAFLDAGHSVDLYYNNQMALLASRLDQYDVVLTPYLWADQYRDLEAYAESDCRFVMQMGGFGNTNRDPQQLERVVETADAVTALDPGPAMHYADQMALDLDEVAVIPNAPNADLFDPQPADASEGFILTPKVGAFHKTGVYLVQTAAQTGDIVYEAHLKRAQDFQQATGGQKPANVHLKPPVPFTEMRHRYRDCTLVFNAAERETLPNVCFESFLTQRAYVAHREAAALLQTVPELDADDFGLSVNDWMDEYEDLLYAGDHLYLVSDINMLPAAIRTLVSNPEERDGVAERGREWVEDAFGDFTWADKAERIIDVAFD